ncbi:MAG: hypothetical protein H7Z42_07955 [Roseiflexaceae bacterium]|nr:hypothetical protein [Roseiflexaceae bacterium]
MMTTGKRWLVGLFTLLTLGVLLFWQTPTQNRVSAAPTNARVMYVISFGDVAAYDLKTGRFLRQVLQSEPGVEYAYSLATGPDGDLYVLSYTHLLRYQGDSGAFISSVPLGNGNVYRDIRHIQFAPDGTLYTLERDGVRRYDARTGADLGIVVPLGGSAYPPPGVPYLRGANAIEFGPDGDLYILVGENGRLYHYSARGVYINTVALESGDFDFDNATDFTFTPSGTLLFRESFNSSITNNPNRIAEFNQNGELLRFFASGIFNPSNITFGPDNEVYVISNGSRLLRYAWPSGALIDQVIEDGNGLGGVAFAGGATRASSARLASVVRANPANNVKPGGTLTYTISTGNQGKGATERGTLSLALDPQLVRVVDAQFSRGDAWVRTLNTTELAFHTGFLNPGDIMTATIQLAVQPDAPLDRQLTAQASVTWIDDSGGGASQSNSVRLRISNTAAAAAPQMLAVTPLSATPGADIRFNGDSFIPSEPVALWYNTPDGKAVEIGRVAADAQGALVTNLATTDLRPGWYSLVAAGVWSKQTLVGAFEVR